MRMMKLATIAFLLSCGIFTELTRGVVITPSNVVIPTSPGGLFSFDYIISDAMSTSAQAFQATMSVSGPGVLTFDVTSSEAVDAELGYWLHGNSAGVTAIDLGSNSYQFGDGPDNGIAQSLAVDDIMARYAFTWGGTVGDYTFTLDFDTAKSFILNGSFVTEPLQFNRGQYLGDDSSFTITIVPEPTTILLLALGGAGLLKRHRA